MLLCWRDSLFGNMLVLLCLWSSEGGKKSITFVGTVVMSIVIVLRVCLRDPLGLLSSWET
jgi:hypothetical protein